MKRHYIPTEADRLTGAKIRDLRNRRGETLKQAVENSGFGRDASTLAATERGERRLTEIEATKLAAHYGTTPDKIIVALKRPARPETEQSWLGNSPAESLSVPTLFAVPELLGASAVEIGRTITIDLDSPLTPDQYREQVWYPYLETLHARTEQKAG